MPRIIRMLVAATAAGGLALIGLMAAGTAAATSGPGTTGPGSWSFDPGTGQNAIQQGGTSTKYRAQVQPPINADGSSVFNHKSATIPLQFTLQQDTVTTPSVYPDTLTSNASTAYGNLGVVPAGSFKLSDINNLTANFTWLDGHNYCGGMRWQIDTPAGNVHVYYGDAGTSFQTGTGQSGDNLRQLTTAAVDDSQLVGHYNIDTWANVLSVYGSEPVNRVALILDGYAGCGGATQQVQLSSTVDPAVTVGIGSETDTYTPGTVGAASDSGWVNTNTPPMWVSLYLSSSATPIANIDEQIVSTQGDSGGQYRQVDGKYMYNLPVNSLQDLSASYNVGISPTKDGASVPITNATNPTGLAHFGLK